MEVKRQAEAATDVVVSRVSPPRPKRPKLEGPEVVDAEPLRCSTPQPVEGESGEEENGEEDLDATLDSLGISHENIEAFFREVDEDEDVIGEETEQRGRGTRVGGVTEIVEDILAQLPIAHLYGNCRLVCRHWNEIILREKFLYWKKLYYMYKSGRCPEATRKVHDLSRRVWTLPQTNIDTVTIPLARFVGEQFQGLAVGSEMEKELLRHPRSPCVARIRELYHNIDYQKDSTVVSTIVLLVMCSRSVHEVQAIIATLLTSSPSNPLCKRVDVMEVFYCLANLLLVGSEERERLPMRFHYNVFYALNVTERCSSSRPPPSAVGEDTSGLLTTEQLQVVNYSLQPGEVIKVLAFAGTGKTTTLLRFTALNPHMRFLYCVYNKSVQEHACTIFHHNVKCQTFHSLAHGSIGDPSAVGWKYLSKRGSLSSYSVSQCVVEYKVKDLDFKQSLHFFSRQVFQTLEKFIASADMQLMDHHIPTTVKMRRNVRMTREEHAFLARCHPYILLQIFTLVQIQSKEKVRQLNHPKFREHVLREAQRYWERMIDTGDKHVRMTDDGYLKYFQLSNPVIRGYDCLLVDEAQDLTPAIISLVTSQTCAKIFVGDTHQQIYGFRGATNALEQITADRTFHLTESFRFGPEIAYVAACCLSTLKGIWRQTLVGSSRAGRVDGVPEGQVAIIARMNATLFEEMVKTVKSGRNLKLGFAGGIHKYEFDMYLDIHKLRKGQHKEITHKFVKKWKSFDALLAFAEKTDDVALINKIKICQKYPDLPQLIEKIRSMHSQDISQADIVFSTAHKSKGLEFDTVQLTDDYSVYDDDHTHFYDDEQYDDRDHHTPDVEEMNILYVAVTRAKRSLILSKTLARVLKESKEHCVYPTVEISEQESQGMCSVCKWSLPKPYYPLLHLQSLHLKVTGNPQSRASSFTAGMVCASCASETLPCLYAPPPTHTSSSSPSSSPMYDYYEELSSSPSIIYISPSPSSSSPSS